MATKSLGCSEEGMVNWNAAVQSSEIGQASPYMSYGGGGDTG